MKTFQKLSRFPLGSIHPEGFLKEQMLRGKNGMAGHLYELEPGMIHDPFIHKTHVPAWGNGDQSGWGAEISGNYWTGYIQHAFVLNDPDMIQIATDWVNTMIPGANYLYMARPEAAPSVLDILPPNFVLRILVMASAITFLYFVAYLPWMIKDIKAKKLEVK